MLPPRGLQHPIWSIERQDWVERGDLKIGEHLWTEDGPWEVLSTRLLSTAESVYNLEVHEHDIYQVGDAGVLVHNAKGDHATNPKWRSGGPHATCADYVPDGSSRLHGEREAGWLRDIDMRSPVGIWRSGCFHDPIQDG